MHPLLNSFTLNPPFFFLPLFFYFIAFLCHLSTLRGIGGAPTFLLIFSPPLCIDISSSSVTWHQWKGLTFLKSIIFFYCSNIFFQSCWFACEVHRVFRVHARPHVHLPCFPCCTTWKITPRWTSAEDHACTMSRYSWGQRLACSFARKRAGELTRWLQPSVPP